MGERKFKYLVTSTLVVRNIDPVHPIILGSVEYRDSKGEHLRPYLEDPRVIAPLASTEFVVKESDNPPAPRGRRGSRRGRGGALATRGAG